MNRFVIYGNVPSSKNTREIAHPRTKRARWNAPRGFQGDVITKNELPMMRNKSKVIASRLVRDYEKRTEMLWISYAAGFRKAANALRQAQGEGPLRVSFKFIRDSNRKFDYINAAQIVQDLMVKHGWIEDDNADELVPVFEAYEVNKKECGVVISIIN